MARLTKAELEAIRNYSIIGIPWGGSDAQYAALSRIVIPKLLAEVDQLHGDLGTAERLLSDAHVMLNNVQCYDTDLYRQITKYFYGEEDA